MVWLRILDHRISLFGFGRCRFIHSVACYISLLLFSSHKLEKGFLPLTNMGGQEKLVNYMTAVPVTNEAMTLQLFQNLFGRPAV